MFCSSCGTKLNDGARFCPNCGTMQNAAPQAPVSQQPKAAYPPAAPQAAPVVTSAPAGQNMPKAKKNRLPLIIGIAGGAALLILGIVLAVVLIGKGSGNLAKNYAYVSNEMLIVEEDGIFGDSEYVLTDGENTHILLGSDAPYPVVYDEFGKTDGFYIVYENGMSWYEEGGILYRFDKNGTHQVADKVDTFRESADGSTMFYAQRAPFYSESEPTVHLHVNRNGKDTDFEMMDHLADFCISPDGSAIYFCGNDTLSFKYCVYVNGKITELPDDFHPGYVSAISNDGKTIFYVNESYDGYYVWDDGEVVRLGNQDYYGSFTRYYNLDCTQVIYHNDEQTYYWAQGDDSQTKISSDALEVTTPYNALYWGMSVDSFEHIIGIRNFHNIFLQGSDGPTCYYLDKDLELRTVIRDYSMLQLAEDGKTLVVLKREKLYEFDGTKEYKDPSKTEVASGYVNFAMTGDAKDIYLLDQYSDLYYLNGSGKPSLLAEGITNPYLYGVSSLTSDGRLYYVDHGDVYWAKGNHTTQVTGFEGEAMSVYPSHGKLATLYTTEDYRTSYYYIYPDGDVVLSITWD